MKLHFVRNDIARMRGQVRAQEREIRMLQRTGVPSAAAELLLVRMRAKIDDLCKSTDLRRLSKASDVGENAP